MPKRVTVYSQDAISVIVATLPVESGRGPDSFLTIEQQEDDVSYQQGCDGEGVFNKKNNNYTKVTMTLMQTSEGNTIMWGIKEASDLAGGAPFPLSWADRNGVSKGGSIAAMILKNPNEAFAAEAGTVVWELGVHDPQRVIGGH